MFNFVYLCKHVDQELVKVSEMQQDIVLSLPDNDLLGIAQNVGNHPRVPAWLTSSPPNEVILKQLLYFLAFSRNFLDLGFWPDRRDLRGSGGVPREGSITFPQAQHIPSVSPVHFNALQ